MAKADLKAQFKALPAGKKRAIIEKYTQSFNCSMRTFYERIRGTYRRVDRAEVEYLTQLITTQ